MIKLFTDLEFQKAKSKDLLPLTCYNCGNTFYWVRSDILAAMKGSARKQGKFCGNKCQGATEKTAKKVACANCNLSFEKAASQIAKSKRDFCTRSCAAKFNNKHKEHGNRRSKLETWLAHKLTTMYPDLDIHYNKKGTINSELDIYIPSLKIAFEINGIFHYKPIYGLEKFKKIVKNDLEKIRLCKSAGIDLIVIDVSLIKRFNEKDGKNVLDKIVLHLE